jgi:chorismate synthase
MSTFGTLFKVTTFGESHCAAVGAIVEGCPPGLPLCDSDLQPQLTRRRPGQSEITTAVCTLDVAIVIPRLISFIVSEMKRTK